MARPALFVALVLFLAGAARADNPIVRFTTPIGSFDVELCEAVSTACTHGAPNTVANFLSYVDEGAYEGSVIHRSVFNFVLQGGSFARNDVDDVIRSIPTVGHEPVVNEFLGQSNVSGTLAVPLQSDPPDSSNPCDTAEDSGTSGFFINVGNNAGLDCGLFTVFGRVMGDGMATVVAQLHALQRWNLNSALLNPFFDPNGLQGAFTTTPMLSTFTGSVTDVLPHFVTTEITRVPEPAATAAALAAFASLAALARPRRGCGSRSWPAMRRYRIGCAGVTVASCPAQPQWWTRRACSSRRASTRAATPPASCWRERFVTRARSQGCRE